MRIHRLRVRHVKGISKSELSFPETGVVVIEGPNEVGKSTLLEALDRLLDPKAKATSRASSITSLQPVGQDVGPYVEAEMSIGCYRLVFAKQWLRQPATTLEILTPEPEQLTGQDAQARMTSILDECLDRTLFDALRLAQSGAPGAIELGDSAVLEAALDAAAGAALHADEGAMLLEAVEREYQRYYTPTTGRVSGELREAQAAVTEGEHRHEQAQHEVREVEELFERRENLASEMIAGEQRAHFAAERERAAQSALGEVTALRTREASELSSLHAAEQSHHRAVRDLEVRQALVDEEAARGEQTRQHRERSVELRSQREVLREELGASEQVLRNAAEHRGNAQSAADGAAENLALARADVELAVTAGRVHTAERAVVQLEHCRAELAQCPITDVVLEELRRRSAEIDVAQARVEASATSITVSAPDPGHSVEIAEEGRSWDPGHEAIERLVSDDVLLWVDSQVRIEIRPDAQARERVARRDALTEAWGQRMTELGVADLADAEVRGARRSQLVGHAADLDRDLTAALQGEELSDLQDKLAAVVERRDGTLADVSDVSDGCDVADVATLRTALEEAAREADRARHALPELSRLHADAQRSVDAARVLDAEASAALEVVHAHLDSAVAEQERSDAALTQARLVAADEEVREHVRDTQDLCGHAKVALRQTRAALAEEGAQAREEDASEASAEATRALAGLQRVRHEFHEVKGRLEQVAAEGRQETAERADQALGDARRRYASVERRAVAAHQLRSTLQRHRTRAHESYAEPYAQQIELLGQQVYGETFSVRVSSDLVITHRSLHGDIVPFSSLSGGAKEQLGILARLSVAALVADQQSVPVVVDDALGYSDPQRLRDLGAVLAGGGGTGQLLLLTCTPDRYADIPGARTIRMTA